MCNNELEGLQIIGLTDNSPLRGMGIKKGDWIVEYDGHPVINREELEKYRENAQDKQFIILQVLIDNQERFFRITPGNLGVYLAERFKDPEIKEDAKRIEGIKQLEWNVNLDNEFFGSFYRILEITENKVDFRNILGASAFSFRLHFHKDWSIYNTDPTIGFNNAEYLFKNIGLKYKFLSAEKTCEFGKKISKKKLIQEITKSIDNNIPVMARNLTGHNSWGLIVGYQNNKSEFFCRTYHNKTVNYSIASQFPDLVLIFEEPLKINLTKEIFAHAILIAKQMLETDMYGEYYSGLKAFNYWQDKLIEDDKINVLPAAKLKKIINANRHTYIGLYKYRKLGAQFLKYILHLFPDSEEHLKKLSKLYNDESNILSESMHDIPHPNKISLPEDWNRRIRNKEMKSLIKGMKKEREILTILKSIPIIKKLTSAHA